MVLRYLCEFETSFVSVERVIEYTDLEAESSRAVFTPQVRNSVPRFVFTVFIASVSHTYLAVQRVFAPQDSWPRFGLIHFHGVYMKYKQDLDYVLKGQSINYVTVLDYTCEMVLVKWPR